MKEIIITLVLCFSIAIIYSCRKDNVTSSPSAKLSFSVDTLFFDTTFTTLGSTTKRLKVYNPNNDKVIISNINLTQGNNSPFRINVDGLSGNSHTDIEINGKDSLYIFLEVTIDPNDVLSPFVVNEQLNFLTNGNEQSVPLVAWGQNAHYYVANQSVSGINIVYLDRNNSDGALDSTWTNDKPYVIYGGYLTIDGDDKLTIEAGTQVHLHNSSGIWVFKDGNIQVNGTLEDPVTFQGTRLEHTWQDVPSQWDRLWINEGNSDNIFNHAIIKNAFIGIQAETLPFTPNSPTSSNKLRLNNCEIRNNTVGILAINYRITDTNSVLSNSGQYILLLRGGGNYQFNHTTIANYWSQSSRETPSIFLQNFYADINGNTQVRDMDAANFYNCIIDGNQEVEFDHEVLDPGTVNFKFDHCILKTTESTTASNYINVIVNPATTLFNDIANHDYSLISGSAASNAGKPSGVLFDHAGNSRGNPPDIGAFED